LGNKVNTKRLIITMFAVFVYIFISDFVIHGLILKETYMQTADLWRTEEEMKSFMIWMFLGQFIIAKFFTLIFVKGYENKGVAEGVRFGILMSGVSVGAMMIQYAVIPMTTDLIIAWIVLGILQTIGA